MIKWFRVQFGINKHEQILQSLQKIARARRASAICSLRKIYEYLFIPNCTRKIIWLLVNNIQVTISVTLQYFFRDKWRIKLLQLYWMKIWHVNSSVKFIHSLQVMYGNWAVSLLPVKSSLIHILIQEPDQNAKENFPVVLMRPSLKLFFERLKIDSVPCSTEFILAKRLFN